MDLRQLESFLKIAEGGSFSLAAAALNVAQPSLSRQIRQLEADLGAVSRLKCNTRESDYNVSFDYASFGRGLK